MHKQSKVQMKHSLHDPMLKCLLVKRQKRKILSGWTLFGGICFPAAKTATDNSMDSHRKDTTVKTGDPVNHPSHYTAYPVEVITLTECMNFNRGNAVKYVARAGLKDKKTEVQDLEKAIWYLKREVARLGKL